MREPLRLLIVSQWYDPEPIPKPGELARAMAQRGHAVEVLTGLPYYPGSRVTPGYRRKAWSAEVVDGVRIIRVPEFPYHGQRGFLRALNYLTFLAMGLAGGLRLTRPDVIYSWHPPTTVGVLGTCLAHRFRVPLVHDIQDLWPEMLAREVPEGTVAHRALRRMEAHVRARADLILTPTHKGATLIAAGFADSTRVHAVPHWFRAPAVPPRQRNPGGDGRFHLLFAGNIGAVQGLDVAIEAARRLRHTPLRLHVLGDGSEKRALQELAKRHKLDNVLFHARVDAAEAAVRMRQADALLLGIRATPFSQTALPTKFIAYTAAARPIVAFGRTAADDVVMAKHCGWVAQTNDVEGLTSAIGGAMAASPEDRARRGQAARRLYEEEYQYDVVMDQYERLLSQAASTSTPRWQKRNR